MKEKLLILTGPTAIGKTELSLNLATKLNGEIISSDSMQIYKHMNIGTAKATYDERKIVKHHLVDYVEIDQNFTVSDFQADAMKVIKELNDEQKLPVVTGGTGLYINSLTYKLNFAQIPADESIRMKYEKILDEFKEDGKAIIHNKLVEIDPISAGSIHLNDVKRVIRALEVYDITGKTMSEYNANFRSENDKYDLCMIALTMDRAKLYERINTRVDDMFNLGLVDEVKSILDMGYDDSLISLQGIGYKEVIKYINKDISLEECIDTIKQGSRNYAKRQLTWFRRDNRFKWFNKDDYETNEELEESIISYIKNKLEGELNE